MYSDVDYRYSAPSKWKKNSKNFEHPKKKSINESKNLFHSRRDSFKYQEDDWHAKLEKKVKETIPEIIRRHEVASYKDIEENLVKKLKFSKSEFSYLTALDELIQSKQIYLVHQKPDVFALQPGVSAERLNRYLTYLQYVKQVNVIKNAPKNGSKSDLTNIMNGNTLIGNYESSDNQIISPTTDSTNCNKCNSSTNHLHQQIINDLNNKPKSKSSLQVDQITSTTNQSDESKEQEDEEQNDDENCKEESVKDLPNRIVISNMTASKSGDKQKAKRRKARRIRKASKKDLEKKKNQPEDDANKENKSTNLISLQEQTVSSTTLNDERIKDENLKYENSSQISSSSDSEDNFQLLPDSEIYPSEDIYQKISDAGFDYESIITRFANWNRSPISALNEFGQIIHISVKLEITNSSGPDHDKLFEATAFLDKRKLAVAWGKSKKRAKGCASELAIRAITASLPSERCDLDIKKYSNHFDQLAVLSYAKFNELLVLVPNYVNFGRKIVATILMKTPDNAYDQVVAVGTGNRCVSGEFLVTHGQVVFDSHAEVIARRSFLNFLMKQIEFQKTGEQESIFAQDDESSLLVVKPGIEFHLYISTAPCGDGALFTHSSNQTCLSELDSHNHTPLFETFLHGRLRTKMEAGEGTISLDENYKSPELDQILRGERLRTMSCSDKICRWNLLGVQGCLLLHFIKPIYLKSISLGSLYHNGHLARACCCRLDKEYFDETLNKPNNVFKLNHPSLGCPISFKFPREPVKTKSDSLNWSLYEDTPELTNGNTGLKFNSEKSRICKFELFDRFKKLCALYGKDELTELTYFEVKEKVENYNELKQLFFNFLKQKKYGPWVCKPLETKVFK